MQAYASAQATSVGSKSRFSSRLPTVQAAMVTDIAGATDRANGAESSSSILASLILDGLDDHGLAALARRLLPQLRQPADAEERGHIAYTVASLADELGVSQKTIRSAIARRELRAVKRGSRWIISGDSVRAWAATSGERRRTGRARGTEAPKAAGPSLHAVFSEAMGRGGAR
jgi:excisionase family DNA binding protein